MRIGKRRVLGMVIGSLGFAGCAPDVPLAIETIQSAPQALDASNAWMPAAHMLAKRQEHAALQLKSQRILVVGGTADPSKTAESYDLATNEWKLFVSPKSITISTKPGCRPALAQLEDGTVIVISTDWGANTSTVSTLDTSTANWTPIYNLPNAACLPTVVALNANRALILADDIANTQILPYIYKHDLKTVEPTTALPAPKEGSWLGSAVIGLGGGRVLVSGGAGAKNTALNNESLVYSSDLNTWIPAGEMVLKRAQHAMSLLPDGNVLAVGGYAEGPYEGQWSETAEIFDVQTMSWGPAAPMANARIHGHTATLLGSSLILVIGGSISSTAELFDPSANEWATLESPDDVRYYSHSSTLLDSGQVLVTGGALTGESDTVSLCEALAFAWEPIVSISEESRGFHSATALNDGTLLVVGGTAEDKNGSLQSLQDAWVFSTGADNHGSWASANSPTLPRGLHTATKLLDGWVLVAGGVDESAIVAELFDPNLKTWTPAASLPIPIMRASATLLKTENVEDEDDGRVLHVGGIYSGGVNDTAHEVLLYDPDSNAWISAPDLPKDPNRFGHSATLLTDGTVLITGGFTSCPAGANDTTAVATVTRYDPATNTWSDALPMTRARAFHSATRLRDGRVLVAGGGGNIANNCLRPTWYSVHTTTEIYDPDADTWTPAGSLNEARTEHQAILLESGRVLIGGGRRSSNRILSTAEIFDPDDKTWTNTSRFQTGRYGHSLTLLDTGVLAVGGFLASSKNNGSVERYPQADNGESCTIDDQCVSMYCTGSICCNSECNDRCSACSAAAATAAGKTKVKEDGICEDVSGCAPFACKTETGKCGETCTDLEECASGYVCDPTGACIEPRKNASTIEESGCAAAPMDSNASPWTSLALVAGAYALRRRKHHRKS